ncbi:hypothetical protein BKD83_11145 [Corynebacterium diphtheriae]|nr:hypothetical protein [Corynebacterium diphtheriae]AEX47237.1 hypothetical protein CDB402_1942 [Corynebacterium diphtheriae INCA 402]OFI50737.1 hypothetical protein BKD83_11145 [Corynebacterium diphtheriae]OJI02494.1 hypothetical protein BKD75_08095 [Corynebacterium diphtheriae]
MPRNTQLWCHDLAGFLHGNVIRQDTIFHEVDHSVFGILVKFSLACSKIFPSTQTEQDLGHFTMPLRGYEYGRLIGTLSHVYPPEWKQVSPQANMRNQNTYKGSINETLADLTYIEVTRS